MTSDDLLSSRARRAGPAAPAHAAGDRPRDSQPNEAALLRVRQLRPKKAKGLGSGAAAAPPAHGDSWFDYPLNGNRPPRRAQTSSRSASASGPSTQSSPIFRTTRRDRRRCRCQTAPHDRGQIRQLARRGQARRSVPAAATYRRRSLHLPRPRGPGRDGAQSPALRKLARNGGGVTATSRFATVTRPVCRSSGTATTSRFPTRAIRLARARG